MELDPQHVVPAHSGGELRAVLRRGDGVRPAVGAVVGVDEVHAVPLPDVPEQGGGGLVRGEVEGVPADVGHLVPGGDHLPDGLHRAGDQAETGVFPVLQAPVEEELHPQADAQQGLPRPGLGDDHPVQAVPPQEGSGVGEGPHAGEDQLVRLLQNSGVAGDLRLGPDGPEGGAQGEQVPHAVVNDSDHVKENSFPQLRRRSLAEFAPRTARKMQPQGPLLAA